LNEVVKQRWVPVGVIAAGLFVVNLAGRWAASIVKDADRQTIAGIIALGAITLVFVVMAIIWGRGRPVGRVVADLGIAAAAGCALSVLLAPFLAGSTPFANGPGAFFEQIWWYAALAGGGTGLGLIILISIGKDHRAQQLKRYTERMKSVPRRVV
jgi:hypothetical protein